MTEPDDLQPDRLSPHTVHALMNLLTAIRGQACMVRRWVRLDDDRDGFEAVLARLALTDTMIQQLAAELLVREREDDRDATDAR